MREERPADRRSLLTAALGFALVDAAAPELSLVRAWLGTWSGLGLVAAGMARQGYDLSLTRYDERGWRATFYTTGWSILRLAPLERDGSARHGGPSRVRRGRRSRRATKLTSSSR